jgi:hypothetical protein
MLDDLIADCGLSGERAPLSNCQSHCKLALSKQSEPNGGVGERVSRSRTLEICFGETPKPGRRGDRYPFRAKSSIRFQSSAVS